MDLRGLDDLESSEVALSISKSPELHTPGFAFDAKDVYEYNRQRNNKTLSINDFSEYFHSMDDSHLTNHADIHSLTIDVNVDRVVPHPSMAGYSLWNKHLSARAVNQTDENIQYL